jgi:hypothetical protein
MHVVASGPHGQRVPVLNVGAGEAVAARIASYLARSKLDEARRMVVANDAVRGSEPCPHTAIHLEAACGRLFDPHSIINRSKLLRDLSDEFCVALRQ